MVDHRPPNHLAGWLFLLPMHGLLAALLLFGGVLLLRSLLPELAEVARTGELPTADEVKALVLHLGTPLALVASAFRSALGGRSADETVRALIETGVQVPVLAFSVPMLAPSLGAEASLTEGQLLILSGAGWALSKGAVTLVREFTAWPLIHRDDLRLGACWLAARFGTHGVVNRVIDKHLDTKHSLLFLLHAAARQSTPILSDETVARLLAHANGEVRSATIQLLPRLQIGARPAASAPA
jgi:hypothetical protein